MLTAEQLMEWEAYDRLEPIGDERIELHIAVLCATVTNLFKRALGTKGTKLSSPLDFLICWDKDPQQEEAPVPVQSIEEQRKVLMEIFAQAGGRKKTDGNHRNLVGEPGVQHSPPKER